MQIDFERSGGLIAIQVTAHIDTDDLPPDEAAQIIGLVQAANFFKLPEHLQGSGADVPDAFQYVVTVDDGLRTHTVTTTELNAPESLHPLLHHLARLARRRTGPLR